QAMANAGGGNANVVRQHAGWNLSADGASASGRLCRAGRSGGGAPGGEKTATSLAYSLGGLRRLVPLIGGSSTTVDPQGILEHISARMFGVSPASACRL